MSGRATRKPIRSALVSAAIAGILSASSLASSLASAADGPPPPQPAGSPGEEGVCFGANSCKGKSGCGTPDGSNACKGQNSCKGKGIVGMTRAECEKVIKKNKNKKQKISFHAGWNAM